MRALVLLFVCAAALCAQDPFEIVIFEYEPLPLGAYTYETHLNYVLAGTKEPDGSVAPTQHQFHFSSEWTMGLTDQLRAGFVLLTAHRPGNSLEYAGFRLLPHFYAPRSWGLPVNLGLVAEFSFERPQYDENARTLELRGIVEKHIGRLQLDGNLAFARALRGPGMSNGWGLEPSGRIGWRLTRKLTPSVEYYGFLGPVSHLLPAGRQSQLILPGADWELKEHVKWSFGAGVGLTDVGSRFILKSRFEFEFGKEH